MCRKPRYRTSQRNAMQQPDEPRKTWMRGGITLSVGMITEGR
jgi:hypothetical protein